MRPLIILLLIAGTSVAHAGAKRYTPLVDIRAVDVACRKLAEVPRNARVPGPSYDAAISTANCLAMVRTRRLHLTPGAESVSALDAAVAPAIRILDDVIEIGDAEHRLIALYAKADLLQGNAERLLLTVPRLSPQMGSQEVHDHYRDVLVADTLTQPWRHRALECRRQIARLVIAHPQLATRDVVLAHMVTNSRIGQAGGRAAG